MPTPPDVATIIGHLVPINHDFIKLPTSGAVVATITSATYTITTANVFIRVDTTSNAITLTLPDPATRHAFFLKDVGGILETNNVTMDRFGSEAFEDLLNDKILTTNYGGWFIWSDGTDWWMN